MQNKKKSESCDKSLDESSYLDHISMFNYSSYCLSYTFTSVDFPGAPIGVAWLAQKHILSESGYCAKYVPHKGEYMSLNTGIVSIRNYGRRLPLLTSQLTFAHEVGHSFGAHHDPELSGRNDCSPGDANGGNYLMYFATMVGKLRNNRNFSECSRASMGPIMHIVAQDEEKFCFKKFTGPLCGNQIVEEGEECDCGYREDCLDKCCYDANHENPSLRCKLRPGAQCSPTQGNCCDLECKFKPKTTKCVQDHQCMYDINCSGYHAKCPSNNEQFFKPNFTFCNSNSQLCMNGECIGTVCEEMGLRQCYLRSSNIWDKSYNRSKLCNLACIGELTGFECVDAFEIEFIRNYYNESLLRLRPGSVCSSGEGFCDSRLICQPMSFRGPLIRLFKLSSIIYKLLFQNYSLTVFIVFIVVFMLILDLCIRIFSPKKSKHGDNSELEDDYETNLSSSENMN